MPFTVRTFEQTRADLLRDIKNALPDADIGPDSDFYIRASSVASVIENQSRDLSWIVRQIFPDTADSDYLELHARTRGLRRKKATTATGEIKVTGEPGATLPAALEIKRDKLSWLTTEEALINDEGIAVVHAQAAISGIAGNIIAPVNAQFVSAPVGVDSAVIVNTMTGGTESETDAALLARLLDLIRRPPAGGNKYDYKRWALEVDGVTNVIVYPLRRGLGTVDLVVISGDSLPSEEVLDATYRYIDNVRPVGASDFAVLAPAINSIDFDVDVWLDGITIDEAVSVIKATIYDAMSRLAPGETLIKSQLEALISAIPGITDRVINSPASNVKPDTASLVEWLRVGSIEVHVR